MESSYCSRCFECNKKTDEFVETGMGMFCTYCCISKNRIAHHRIYICNNHDESFKNSCIICGDSFNSYMLTTNKDNNISLCNHCIRQNQKCVLKK